MRTKPKATYFKTQKGGVVDGGHFWAVRVEGSWEDSTEPKARIDVRQRNGTVDDVEVIPYWHGRTMRQEPITLCRIAAIVQRDKYGHASNLAQKQARMAS